jgi:hypothetical protein
MMTYYKISLCLIFALLVAACSHEKEDEVSDPMYPDKEQLNVSLNGSFRGVWSVDDVSADTVDVDVKIGNDKLLGVVNVTFYGFPYQAIADLFFPGQKIERVNYVIPSDLSFRIIGYSKKIVYLEFEPNDLQSMDPRCLYFNANLEGGKEIGISIRFVSSSSKATLDVNGESFSCPMRVDMIVCSEGSESSGLDHSMIEKNCDPPIVMKYTSIKRIERATIGN